MARIRKPSIRKIESVKKTPTAPSAESDTSDQTTTIHAEKPKPQVKVDNPGILDKDIEKALHTEEAILFQTKSVFPLDIIPNELIIREKSVSIIWNYVINSNTQTMLIKDIGYITINDNKILAALVISYKSPLENIEINNLKPEDAYQAKSIIEKLMIQISEGGIDKKPEDESSFL